MVSEELEAEPVGVPDVGAEAEEDGEDDDGETCDAFNVGENRLDNRIGSGTYLRLGLSDACVAVDQFEEEEKEAREAGMDVDDDDDADHADDVAVLSSRSLAQVQHTALFERSIVADKFVESTLLFQ